MKDVVQSEPVALVLNKTAEFIGKSTTCAAWGVKSLAFIGVTVINDGLTVALTSISIIYMGIKIYNEITVYRKNKSK